MRRVVGRGCLITPCQSVRHQQSFWWGAFVPPHICRQGSGFLQSIRNWWALDSASPRSGPSEGAVARLMVGFQQRFLLLPAFPMTAPGSLVAEPAADIPLGPRPEACIRASPRRFRPCLKEQGCPETFGPRGDPRPAGTSDSVRP